MGWGIWGEGGLRGRKAGGLHQSLSEQRAVSRSKAKCTVAPAREATRLLSELMSALGTKLGSIRIGVHSVQVFGGSRALPVCRGLTGPDVLGKAPPGMTSVIPCRLASALWLLLWLAAAAHAGDPTPAWQPLGRGVEYAALRPAPRFGSGAVQVVRIDPKLARLRAVMSSALDHKPRTAGAFCDNQHLLAAINLGMFLDDHVSNVGYARAGSHLNHGRWVQKYKSVLVFGPKRTGLKAAAILDLDAPGTQARLDDYETVVQNLRLIRAPGQSTWGPQPKRWSEAAVAMDSSGRILFLFARAPHSMSEFNQMVLALPLGIVAAMHVEGGPEASLSLRGPLRLDFNGSFETGFIDNDSIVEQWPIPNVLSVVSEP